MEVQGCTRVMALHGELLLFQCRRSPSEGSEIAFWRMSFKRDLSRFLNDVDCITPMYKSSSTEVNIVHCSSAVDIKTKQRVPCVLLRLIQKGTPGFKYMLYSLNNTSIASLHAELTVPYEMGSDLSVLCGPTLVWRHEGTIFYMSPQTSKIKKIPISLTVNFIGELPLRKRELVVVGSRMHSSMDVGEWVNVTKENKTLLYFLEDGRTFSGSCIFPDAYSSLIQCMVVLSAEDVGGSIKSTVLAATCRKQLLHFVNGLPEDMCLLPYEEPQSIQIVHTGTSSCLLAVIFNHGNVCAVWKDTFKVATCWTGVSSLLVDDFVGCGSDQMLVLFDECPGEFLLTDLCSIHYSCGKTAHESIDPSGPSQENVLLTVQALDSRLQSGLAFLQDLQRDLNVKDQVLQQSITALADLVSDREHLPASPLQEGLVSLWDEEDEEHVPNKRVQTEMEQCSHQCSLVQKVWYRVVEQSLVFGLLLTPAAQMVEKKVTGSVLWELCGGRMAAGVVQSWSKTMLYPQHLPPPCGGPPAAKRSRCSGGPHARDHEQLVLLTGTPLSSLLTFGTVTCSVWLDCPASGVAHAGCPCFLLNLDMKEVLQGKFHPPLLKHCSTDSDEAREDLLCMLAVFDSWLLQIESSVHTVVDLGAWLEGRLGAKRVEANPHYLLICSTVPPAATLFNWKVCGPFQGLLGVHSSSKLSVLQFLDSLHEFLPASHHIQLLHRPAPHGSSQGLALRLGEEMQTITEGVASLLQDQEDADVEEFDGGKKWNPAFPEELQSQREEWQSERERTNRRLRPLVSAEQYRSMVEQMIQSQLDGDISALVEVQAAMVP